MARRPKICIDRYLPRELMRVQPRTRGPQGRTRAISPMGKTWMNGCTLRVRFMGGTPAEHAVVREQAGWWTKHANIKFEFSNAMGAEIRIAFDPNQCAWCYIGTDACAIQSDLPTMNLGFLDGGIAAHELGHALGLAHEHRNPPGGIKWNEAIVLRDLSGPPNCWTEAQITIHVLKKYQADQINGTQFDPDSIMLYFFPPEWSKNGVGVEPNTALSNLDEQSIGSYRMYPKR